jgi:hypothetical protein
MHCFYVIVDNIDCFYNGFFWYTLMYFFLHLLNFTLVFLQPTTIRTRRPTNVTKRLGCGIARDDVNKIMAID